MNPETIQTFHYTDLLQLLNDHVVLISSVVFGLALLSTFNAVHARIMRDRPRMCPACTGTGKIKITGEPAPVPALSGQMPQGAAELMLLASQGICLACKGHGVIK